MQLHTTRRTQHKARLITHNTKPRIIRSITHHIQTKVHLNLVSQSLPWWVHWQKMVWTQNKNSFKCPKAKKKQTRPLEMRRDKCMLQPKTLETKESSMAKHLRRVTIPTCNPNKHQTKTLITAKRQMSKHAHHNKIKVHVNLIYWNFSPLMSVLTTNEHKYTVWEAKGEKLIQVIESRTKAKNKVTWHEKNLKGHTQLRKISVPIDMGNGSTQLRRKAHMIPQSEAKGTTPIMYPKLTSCRLLEWRQKGSTPSAKEQKSMKLTCSP